MQIPTHIYKDLEIETGLKNKAQHGDSICNPSAGVVKRGGSLGLVDQSSLAYSVRYRSTRETALKKKKQTKPRCAALEEQHSRLSSGLLVKLHTHEHTHAYVYMSITD